MKSVSTTLNEAYPIICDTLKNNGSVTFSPHGTSMLPIIRDGKDSICIKKPDGKLKKYDVAFYLRKNGQFVLHRVIGINKDGYVFCGDNQVIKEYRITDEQIIGVLSEIYPDNNTDNPILCTSFKYRLYSFFRVKNRILRYMVWRAKRFAKRCLGRG